MTNQQHPITPPPEVEQRLVNGPGTWREKIVNAYCAGADAELEVCLDLMRRLGFHSLENLRNIRRPKPPSLAEQALKAHESCTFGKPGDRATIRAALERLQQLEQENNG